MATHNSYYMNATDNYDFGASGTQEILSDQLLHEHVAALEIDIHSEGAPPKTWKVYHTSDAEDFSCSPLTECLKMLQNFQYAVPEHDVVTVMLELKNTAPETAFLSKQPVTPNFDAKHTIDDLDNLLRMYLGTHLYTPRDLLETCHNIEGTLVECLTQRGGKWPTMDQLRGKFIFTLFGNWGSNYYDWASYATQDPIFKRVAFPMMMAYGIDTDPNALQVWHLYSVQSGEPEFRPRDVDAEVYGKFVKDYSQDEHVYPVWIPKPMHQRAVAQSIFWQFEPTEDKPAMDMAQQFKKDSGIIRVGGPDKDPKKPNYFELPANQLQRISDGFQYIQTDHPWHFAADGGPVGTGIPIDPSHRWRQQGWPNALGSTYDQYRELGEKLYFSVQAGSLGAAWRDEPAAGPYSGFWLETTVSTTRADNTWVRDELGLTPSYHEETQYPRRAQDDPDAPHDGCVQVATAGGQQYFLVCRRMNAIPHFWDDGAVVGYRSPERLQWQERASIYVELWTDGTLIYNHGWWESRHDTCDDQAARDDSHTNVCVGNLISIEVLNVPKAGGIESVAVAMSANTIGSTGTPEWHELERTSSQSGPWSQVGLRASQDVLFAGARIVHFNGGRCQPQGPEQWVRLSDLPHQVVGVGAGPMHIADLSRGLLPSAAPHVFPCVFGLPA